MLGVLDVTRCTRLLDLLAQHMAAPEINKANDQSLCFVYLEFDAKEHKQKAQSLFSTHQSTKTVFFIWVQGSPWLTLEKPMKSYKDYQQENINKSSELVFNSTKHNALCSSYGPRFSLVEWKNSKNS